MKLICDRWMLANNKPGSISCLTVPHPCSPKDKAAVRPGSAQTCFHLKPAFKWLAKFTSLISCIELPVTTTGACFRGFAYEETETYGELQLFSNKHTDQIPAPAAWHRWALFCSDCLFFHLPWRPLNAISEVLKPRLLDCFVQVSPFSKYI